MGIFERIRIAIAAAFMEASDTARVNTALASSATPEELVREARRLRLAALTALDTAVMLALAEGRDWEDVAAMVGLSPRTAYERYSAMYGAWVFGTADGGELDTTERLRAEDPAVRAQIIDQWLDRNAGELGPTVQRAPLTGLVTD